MDRLNHTSILQFSFFICVKQRDQIFVKEATQSNQVGTFSEPPDSFGFSFHQQYHTVLLPPLILHFIYIYIYTIYNIYMYILISITRKICIAS